MERVKGIELAATAAPANWCPKIFCATAQAVSQARVRFGRLSADGRQRVKGIEPSCAAWKAAVLPLNYTRKKTLGPKGFEPLAS